MTNSMIALLGVTAIAFASSISRVSKRKRTAGPGARRKESNSAQPTVRKPLITPGVVLWGIVSISLLGASVSLVIFLAPDDALRARLLMFNQDLTIKPVTGFQLQFIHRSALALFSGFLSFATLINLRRALAKSVVGYLVEDVSNFFGKIVKGGREWLSQGHGVEVACLGIMFLIAIGIRLFFLTQPMGYDESITVVRFSSHTLIDVLSDYSDPNNHVLHTILVYLSSRLFGVVPAVVRLPAFLAGLMIVPVSFWLMRRLFDDYTALLTAGLTAVAPAMVEYSAQARGYTLLTLLFLIAFVIATYLREQSSITGWALFIITFTLGFYTIPIMLYSFGIVVFWLLLAATQQRRKTLFLELTLSSVTIVMGTLLLYLPVILRTGYRYLFSNYTLTPLPLLEFLKRNASNGLLTLQCWTGARYFPVVILISLSVVAAVFFSRRGKRPAVFVLLAIFLWMIPLISYQRIAPPPRVFHFLFAIAAGIASYGLSLSFKKLHIRSNRLARYVWVAVVILISGYLGISRLLIPCAPFPGAEGINQCAEGFFVDSKAIVADMKPVLRERDALVAHVHSGIVESTQFYMLEANRQSTLVHAYSPNKGLRQLDKYDQLFVVTRRDETPSSKDGADVLKMFNCSREDFEKTFDNPELVASYQISDLYRLRRKSTAADLVSNQSRPSGHY